MFHFGSRALYDKRISQEVEGEALGDEFAGYVSRKGTKPSIYFLSYGLSNRT